MAWWPRRSACRGQRGWRPAAPGLPSRASRRQRPGGARRALPRAQRHRRAGYQPRDGPFICLTLTKINRHRQKATEESRSCREQPSPWIPSWTDGRHRGREGGREGAAEFRQEAAGKIVDRRSIEIKGASCNNSPICDQLIGSRGGKRYQSRVNSQSAAWIKLHSISSLSLSHTAHPRTGDPPPRAAPAPGKGDAAPREHLREGHLGSVKGTGAREGGGCVSPGRGWGEKTPPWRSGLARRVRVPRSARGEGSKQPLLNQSAHAHA